MFILGDLYPTATITTRRTVQPPDGGTFLQRYARRWRLVSTILGVQLVLWSLLRLTLFALFREEAVSVRQLAGILTTGVVTDAAAGLTALLPLIFVISVFRLRWLGRPRVRHVLLGLGFFLLCFDVFVEYFFFEEYSARYNHLALDYLMYPDEVFGNIFASYNVPLFVGLAVLAAVALTWWTATRRPPDFGEWRWRDRAAGASIATALAAALWIGWMAAPAAAGSTRIAGELARNGWVELIRAYLTSHLDYDAYYSTLADGDANVRVARVIDQTQAAAGLTRHFAPRGRAPGDPLDIVIIIEESLGSSFSARFGGETESPVTPELDRWSREGLALTNLIANGNRTVRGIEGILCSFVPLPGDAIVKRDRSENVATIARVLAAQGYRTTFFASGYGLFDNLAPFLGANGFERVYDQSDYPSEAFRTVWGVADEFVFDEMIAQQKRAREQRQRWFGVALTVSNHKPFDVPAGRVNWPPDKSRRRGAVLYADWAFGHYMTRAKQEGLLDHTIVLVVGDHGARVYGAEEIPVTSYRIPAVFFTPDPAYRGATIDRLASQVDLAPTLLSLAGIAYDAPFFGQDLIGLPEEGGRAFVNHNRNIGLLTDSTLVVLGLQRSQTFYTRSDRKSDVFTRVAGDSPPLHELAADTAAVYQKAYQTYRERQYRLPDARGGSVARQTGTP